MKLIRVAFILLVSFSALFSNEGIVFRKLGVKYFAEGQNKKALNYFEKACSLKNSGACTDAGQTYQYNIKNLVMARKYYKKGCDLGNAKGCFLLSNISENKKDDKKYTNRACQLGMQIACPIMRFRLRQLLNN